MKSSALLLLGGLLLLSAKKNNQTVGNSQLTPQQYVQAVQTDPLGSTIAQNILNAANASQALALGNAALNGLDLTNPASVAVYTPTFSAQDQVIAAQRQDAAQSDNLALPLASNPAVIGTSNPWTNGGGSYPRFENGVWVQTPNQYQVLYNEWNSQHLTITRS